MGRGTWKKKYLMFAWFQGVVITDEEEAHGSHQELKQLHQGGVTPIWPHLHRSHFQVDSAAVSHLVQILALLNRDMR